MGLKTLAGPAQCAFSVLNSVSGSNAGYGLDRDSGVVNSAREFASGSFYVRLQLRANLAAHVRKVLRAVSSVNPYVVHL
jgi:hypothetical protein